MIIYHTCKHYWFDLDEPEEGCLVKPSESPLRCNSRECDAYTHRQGAPDIDGRDAIRLKRTPPVAVTATNSGRYVSLTDPDPDTIDLGDIAHALSRLTRFVGHTDAHLSVAQHSLIVASYLPIELKLTGLLHDAAEAYLGEVSTPLKSLLPDYRRLEDRMYRVIAEKYGAVYPIPDEVKYTDKRVTATEKRDVLGNNDHWPLLNGYPPFKTRIDPMIPTAAKRMFYNQLKRYT